MMLRRCGRSPNAGFTLIETLMAMTLTVTIVAALATIASQWLPSWNRGFVRVQRIETLALGLDRLRADLQAAEFVPLAGDRGEIAFEGGELGVVFARRAVGPNADGLELVRVTETSTASGLALVRMTAPLVPMDVWSKSALRSPFTAAVILVPPPHRVTFAYADSAGRWRRTWQAAQRLPRAIRLTIRDATTGRTSQLSTIVRLQVDAPSFCIRTEQPVDCVKDLPEPLLDRGEASSSDPRGGAR